MAIDPELYKTTLEPSKINVTFLEKKMDYNISWDSIPEATGYRVYAGFDPFYIKALISGPAPLTTTSFTFHHIPMMPSRMVYFWVKYYNGSTWEYVKTKGTTIYDSMGYSLFNNPNLYPDDVKINLCDYDSRFFVEEIRRRDKSVLYDTGEECLLFIRQWHGLPSPSASQKLGLYSDYQGMSRDDNCFGTGFYPGYFPAINIMVRFNQSDSIQLGPATQGLKIELPYDGFTLWEPLIQTGDVIHRKITGEKYIVKQVKPTNYRGFILLQRLTYDSIETTDPLYNMDSQTLISRWQNINALDFLRIGFNIMVSDPASVNEYLIFG